MNKSAQLGYLPGIEWLRAIFSVAVVIWHQGSAGMSLIGDKARYQEHVFTLSDLINFHFLVLAVPVFFLISCYLYAMKDRTSKDLLRRITRLCLLTLFWSIAVRVWYLGSEGITGFIPDSSTALFWFVMSGGQTLYYFFIALIFGILLTHIFRKCPTGYLAILFAAACACLPVLAAAAMRTGDYHLAAFYNPLNFLPYPFAGILLLRIQPLLRQQGTRTIWLAALMTGGILFSLFEWKYLVHEVFFLEQTFAFPAYTRGSEVFLSIFFFSLLLNGDVRSNRVICFMSKHSLALYCLHPFFRGFSIKSLALLNVSWPALPGELFKIAVVLSCSYLVSVIAGRYIPWAASLK